ncbi:hypothetical protein [Microtetraspora sp. NBRC 16547]|uniref:hypothetical protein n=1 Tax=Microtetraspora sp. NBRC 16547 TaxID=3030993 RepID=UPI0024A24F18|nr:hypothetical protein [Microtetraspora sp. NBRC 16547]GLW97795.1 hypothetical protein Misp02_18820 [Microtetraspora sp. NBRC 16547]
MSLNLAAALHMHQELVDERIRGLHREAAEQRLASRIHNVQKARRKAERASRRLLAALARA